MIVYAVYDKVEGKMYQFAAEDLTLAKDAVMAFVQENALALFGDDSVEDDEFKGLQTSLSNSNSIEEVTVLLFASDLVFNLIKIS